MPSNRGNEERVKRPTINFFAQNIPSEAKGGQYTAGKVIKRLFSSDPVHIFSNTLLQKKQTLIY